MTIDLARTGLLAAALLASAGCAEHSQFEAVGDASFGEANRQTMMAQVVDPDPVYDTELVTSGEHAADAVERYRNDEVKQPVRETTTQSSQGSSSSPQN